MTGQTIETKYLKGTYNSERIIDSRLDFEHWKNARVFVYNNWELLKEKYKITEKDFVAIRSNGYVEFIDNNEDEYVLLRKIERCIEKGEYLPDEIYIKKFGELLQEENSVRKKYIH